MDPKVAAIYAYAVGLLTWHDKSRYSEQSGAALVAVDGGHKREKDGGGERWGLGGGSDGRREFVLGCLYFSSLQFLYFVAIACASGATTAMLVLLF